MALFYCKRNIMRKRNIEIKVRFTKEEFDALNRKVAKARIDRETYCRRVLAGAVMVEAPPADYMVLIKAVKDSGSTLDKILKQLMYQKVVDTSAIQNALDKNWEAEKMLWETFAPGGR